MTATLPSTADRPSKKPVDREELSTRLLGSAAKKSYDPVDDIDRDAPVATHLYGLSPEWSTLYGAPLWDSSSHDQRVTLTVHEYCSISGAWCSATSSARAG
jgi:P-aminobenzoate N-oxygenase AurF